MDCAEMSNISDAWFKITWTCELEYSRAGTDLAIAVPVDFPDYAFNLLHLLLLLLGGEIAPWRLSVSVLILPVLRCGRSWRNIPSAERSGRREHRLHISVEQDMS